MDENKIFRLCIYIILVLLFRIAGIAVFIIGTINFIFKNGRIDSIYYCAAALFVIFITRKPLMYLTYIAIRISKVYKERKDKNI